MCHPEDSRSAADGGCRTTMPDDVIRRLIPFEAHKTNGRPKILPPAKSRPSADLALGSQILRAIGRAWSWWRRMEAGEFARRQEMAETGGLAKRHVSGQLRLAYLAPAVPKRLTGGRKASAVSLYLLYFLAGEAWGSRKCGPV